MNGEESKVETKDETEFVFVKRDTASEYQMLIPRDVVEAMKDNIDKENKLYVDFTNIKPKVK